jgi:cytochrome P450
LTVPPAAAPPAAAPPQFVSDPAQVRAVLADPEYTVPDPGRGAPPRTMAWLRQNVARFSNGADHARRRDLAGDLLRPLDTGLLRAAAFRAAVLPGRGPRLRAGRGGDRAAAGPLPLDRR